MLALVFVQVGLFGKAKAMAWIPPVLQLHRSRIQPDTTPRRTPSKKKTKHDALRSLSGGGNFLAAM